VNSLKNTIVIVLLLGVSYGVYQVVNVPETEPIAEEDDIQLSIQDSDEETGSDLGADNVGQSSLGNVDAPTNPSFATGTQTGQALGSPSVGLPDMIPEQPEFDANSRQGFAPLPNDPPPLLPDSNNPGNAFAPSDQMVDVNKPNDSGSFGAGNQNSLPDSFANGNSQGGPLGDPQSIPPGTGSFSGEKANEWASNPTGGNAFDTPSDSTNGAIIRTNPEPTGPGEKDFQNALAQVQSMMNGGQYKQALSALSVFYNSELRLENRTILMNTLDMLAGKVIYSSEHVLTGQPYVVQNGETLQSLAAQWKVPPELIYNINRSKIQNPQSLLPGTQLKRIDGPFRAEVSVGNRTLTMFVGGMYAGQFEIDLAQGVQIEPGKYSVKNKSDRGQVYQDRSGQSLPAGAFGNPYGKYWMDLGGGLCIHDRVDGASGSQGCISVNNGVADVFGILSQNSEVTIRR